MELVFLQVSVKCRCDGALPGQSPSAQCRSSFFLFSPFPPSIFSLPTSPALWAHSIWLLCFNFLILLLFPRFSDHLFLFFLSFVLFLKRSRSLAVVVGHPINPRKSFGWETQGESEVSFDGGWFQLTSPRSICRKPPIVVLVPAWLPSDSRIVRFRGNHDLGS